MPSFDGHNSSTMWEMILYLYKSIQMARDSGCYQNNCQVYVYTYTWLISEKKLETKVFSLVKEQSFLTLKLLYFMFNIF